VAGQGPLVEARGLRLAIVAIAKDEGPYLEEWLCFHLALGVDHVFLYDNGSTDETFEVLEPYLNHGLVTLVWWPLPGGQLGAYNHALRFFGPSCDWLAFIDADEFIVPLVDDDIPSLLARYPAAADLQVPRREFGFSGHRTRPDGLVIEAYTQVADTDGRDPGKGPRIKTVLQPRSISSVDIHTATVADRPPEPAAGRPAPSATVLGPALVGVVQLNHYYTRSFEEFEAKRRKGSATGRLPKPPLPFDLPTVAVDTSAHRFIERTRTMIERVRSLERRPYLYGSQLHLTQFPLPNDLGRFAEFALANLAAGLDEAQRGPAIRIRNLYDGVGFLGDLGSSGYRPARAALSRSAHLVALLDHVRGRLETSLDGEGSEASSSIDLSIPSSATRRRYALGFLATPARATGLHIRFEHEGPSPTSLVLDLPAASTYGGIVELDPRPLLASRARIQVGGDPGQLTFDDLFLISYG
jgi:hypothetical protein